MGTYVDGTIAIGEDSFSAGGVFDARADPIVVGKMGLEVDHIEQDPLGAIGGEVATNLLNAATSNNNAAVSPPISHPHYSISLGNGDSLTLTTGVYYVKSIILMNGSTLDIDASGGPVTIYQTGTGAHAGIEAKYGSTINFTAEPGEFRIYSDSAITIDFKNSGHFKGMIYAPYADVMVMNSANAYGLFWANKVFLKNDGEVFIDTTLTEELLSTDVDLVSWKIL